MATRTVWLLAIASFINYVDRGNLATAAPLIQGQLSLTNSELGVLMSAFFWSYIPAQLPAGWLTERYGTRLVLAAGVALWGVATGLTAFAGSFAMLLAMRVLIGLGESVLYPATCVVLAERVTGRERGAANGIVSSSLLFGPSFGVLAGGLIMAQFGWRPVFLVFGALTLLWLWPWLRTPDQHSDNGHEAAGDAPGLGDMFRRRQLWGGCIGHFALAYALYQVMSWLPVYLMRVHGMSVGGMARIAGVSYLMAGFATMGAGWVADRWSARGASENFVRKVALVGGMLGIAVCMLSLSWGSPSVALVAMVACSIFLGIVLSAYSAAIQVMAGPRIAGRWMGFQSALGNFAGLIGPIITGRTIDLSGSFSISFGIAAGVAAVGALGYGLVMGRIEPVRWRQ